MSSSPSRAPLPPAPHARVANDSREVSAFPYSEVAAAAGAENLARTDAAAGRGESADVSAIVQAREAGRQQGERESRAKFEEQLGQARSAIGKALTDFARERVAYYGKIEEEAVQLALSIARKVLHREAQVDPLLLMGIARVALGKIEGATGVVLAVNPQQAAAWRNYFAARGAAETLPGIELEIKPEIREDPAVAPGQCELRTSMGTAALGVEVQLKEIEQGLSDLLAARPQEKEKKLSH